MDQWLDLNEPSYFDFPGFLARIRFFSFDATSNRPTHRLRGPPAGAHRAESGRRKPPRATASEPCNGIRIPAAEQNPGAANPTRDAHRADAFAPGVLIIGGHRIDFFQQHLRRDVAAVRRELRAAIAAEHAVAHDRGGQRRCRKRAPASVAFLSSSREIAASEELRITPGCRRAPSAKRFVLAHNSQACKAVTTSTPRRGRAAAYRKSQFRQLQKECSSSASSAAWGWLPARERGNSSKCCTKTRMTGSGRIKATSSSLARKRLTMLATARFHGRGVDDIGLDRGRNQRGRRAKFPRRNRPASCLASNVLRPRGRAANLDGQWGCGMASSQRESRREEPASDVSLAGAWQATQRKSPY